MGKDLKGKDIGKGIIQRKDGYYQACIYQRGYGKPIYLYSKNLKEIKKKKQYKKEIWD